MSQALQKYEPQQVTLYDRITDPVGAAIQLGKSFAGSGMFGVTSDAAGTILALACLAQRCTPFDIARSYDIIGGKLRKKAMRCAAEFRQLGGKYRWIKTGDDGQEASAEFEFEGQKLTVSFTIEQAKRQGLVRADSNWIKTPGNMLRARVCSNAIAMLAPEVIAGDEDSDEPAEMRPLLPESAPTHESDDYNVAELKKTLSEAQTAPKAAVIVMPPVEPAKQPETAPTQSTPQPQPQQQAQKPPAFTATIDPTTGLLDVDTQSAVLAAIPDDKQDAAHKWFLARGWLKDGQTLGHLTVKRAQSIIDRPAEFLKTVEGK